MPNGRQLQAAVDGSAEASYVIYREVREDRKPGKRADIVLRSERIETLREFSELMRRTRDVRAVITQGLLDGGAPPDPVPEKSDIECLERAKGLLEAIPLEGGRRRLRFNDKSVFVDLSYEIDELAKDLVYLQRGQAALLEYLGELYPRLSAELAEGREFFARAPGRFGCFVTDRDGTVNNYCGRYYSSVQSVYNAVFLTRFARRRCRRSVILTSAPLREGGLVEVSVLPPGGFVLAGSKGREALDEQGRLHRLAISAAEKAALDALNHELARLVERPQFEIFALIGSGLQLKFGQSTVAHQDVNASIPQELSRGFRKAVHELLRRLDPEGTTFHTEDTGKDLEILLTVADRGGALRDFDKGDGVRFLDRELGLGLKRGDTLICGDTASDLPMVAAAVEAASEAGDGAGTQGGTDTWSVFVTQDAALRQAVQAACPRAWFAGRPDVLVTLLNELAKEDR